VNDAPGWLAAAAAMMAVGVSLFNHFKVQELRVSIDGRMGQLIEATQALGREEGKAAQKAEGAIAELHEHETNGTH
jgi:hypothetical protein